MIQRRGGGLPLLLPLLGENPPKNGVGQFGSMAKMEFNRLNRGPPLAAMVKSRTQLYNINTTSIE